MTSNMISLGFPVTTEQDFRHYVYQATEFGRKIETPNGSYTLWEIGSGIELWVQTNLHRRIIGMNPHFQGLGRMQVGLSRRITRRSHSILDGAFYAWTNPQADNPSSGEFPFVFDLPDYDTYLDLQLPSLERVQLAAFAYTLRGFKDEREYMNFTREGSKTESEPLVSCGLFSSNNKVTSAPCSEMSMNGRILETARLTNPVTGQKFYWARVRIAGGTIDVVADPQVVQGPLIAKGMLSGKFWLSGRLE